MTMRSTSLARGARACGRAAVAAAWAGALAATAARPIEAQAWAYPSFQSPALSIRDFTFGIAGGGDAGTSLVVQWREEAGPRSQFSLDAGLADPDARGADNVFFVGGQYAYQVFRSSAEVPLDFLLTAGAGLGFGNKTTLRIPFGVSVGRRFPLEGSLAITPYVHPRVSLDFCGGCGGDESQLGINFDVGANFELTRVVAIRGAAYFGGSDRFGDNGIGFGIVWSPDRLQR